MITDLIKRGVSPLFLGIVAMCAVLAAPASAATQHQGWYATLNLGAQIGNSVEGRSNGLALKAELKKTYTVGATVGYSWKIPQVDGMIRTEVEGTYTSQETNAEVVSGFTGFGDVNFDEYRVMTNFWYDFATTGRLTPYVGGGVGYSFVRNIPFLDNESGIAYQFGGGVRMDLTPDGRAFAGIGYRYMGFGKGDAAAFGSPEIDVNSKGHRLLVEVGYRF